MSWYSDGMPFDEFEGCDRCNFSKCPSKETCDGCTSGDRYNHLYWGPEDDDEEDEDL